MADIFERTWRRRLKIVALIGSAIWLTSSLLIIYFIYTTPRLLGIPYVLTLFSGALVLAIFLRYYFVDKRSLPDYKNELTIEEMGPEYRDYFDTIEEDQSKKE